MKTLKKILSNDYIYFAIVVILVFLAEFVCAQTHTKVTEPMSVATIEFLQRLDVTNVNPINVKSHVMLAEGGGIPCRCRPCCGIPDWTAYYEPVTSEKMVDAPVISLQKLLVQY